MNKQKYFAEPVTKTEDDAIKNDKFGHKAIVDALEQTIVDTPPPICIGLLGEWGVGKTFVLEWLKIRLQQQKHSNKVKVLYYDAWKYSGESVKRSLLMSLFTQQKNPSPDKHKDWLARLYNVRQEPLEVKIFRPFELTRERFTPALIIAFIFIITLIYSVWRLYVGDFTWLVAFEGLSVTSMITFGFATFGLATQLFNLANSATQIAWKTETIPAVASAEQFEIIFNEFLEEVLKESKADRVAVLIDELDRCDAKTRNEVLQGLKTFLKNDKCIYVVVCAPNNINTSSQNSSKPTATKSKEEIPDSSKANTTTKSREELPDEEFLRKLFQINFWIDSQGEENLREYTEKLVQEMFSKQDLELIQIVFLGNTKNPRRVKHFLNSLNFSLSVANARQKDGQIPDIPDKRVTDNVAFLAKILLIRQDWPNQFQEIINYPYILKEWSDCAYSGEYKDELPSDFIRFLQLTDNTMVSNIIPFLAVTLGSTNFIKNRIPHLEDAMCSLDYETAKEIISKTKNFSDWHATIQSLLRNSNKNSHYQWLKNGILVACSLIEFVPKESQQNYADDICKWLKDQRVRDFLKPDHALIIFPLATKAKQIRAMDALDYYLSTMLRDARQIQKSIGKALEDNAANLPIEAKEKLADYIIETWKKDLENNPTTEKDKRPYTMIAELFRDWPVNENLANNLVSKTILRTLIDSYSTEGTGVFKHDVDLTLIRLRNAWDDEIGIKFCEVFFKPINTEIPSQPSSTNNQNNTLSNKPLLYNIVNRLDKMILKDHECFLVTKNYISSENLTSLLRKVYQLLSDPELKIIIIALCLYKPIESSATTDSSENKELKFLLKIFIQKHTHKIEKLVEEMQKHEYPLHATDNLINYTIILLAETSSMEQQIPHILKTLSKLKRRNQAVEAIENKITNLTKDNKNNKNNDLISKLQELKNKM